MSENSNFRRRILIVEDENLTRVLISNLLTSEGFEVQTADSALHASKLTKDFDPDALIVDISLGKGPTGIDLVHSLQATRPYLSFLVLSNFAAPPASIKELKSVAYLQKNQISDPKVLISALNSAMSKPDAAQNYPFKVPNEVSKLTAQQLKVLGLVAQGLSNSEIASRRNTTVESTEQMIGRIYKKLGLERNSAATLRVQATKIYRETLGNN
ncbi:response regulator transcription factor [Candidatus Rhodoluna planktonica]|uniref:Response regulatory domain-containing protein n=1 Tax=Candidatus Rhodoluna planktonica TaxID=535712 RepID=A0A1D9DXF3_9MICO|nr:response regulator transcription factor [Candidatus Rhodoluna planktonica]AOY55483.1 hypothetical protein A4Z71_00205 [Candidatus Rhodoluna planktonica]